MRGSSVLLPGGFSLGLGSLQLDGLLVTEHQVELVAIAGAD